MSRHRGFKQIIDVEGFIADAQKINEIYSGHCMKLRTDSPQYKALRRAEDALWDLVREVTGKETLPWAASPPNTGHQEPGKPA